MDVEFATLRNEINKALMHQFFYRQMAPLLSPGFNLSYMFRLILFERFALISQIS